MSYKSGAFNRTTLKAVAFTALLSVLMQPCMVFGWRLPDLGVLAWIHLVPLAAAQHPYNLKSKIGLSFLAGFAAHFGVFYWLINAMTRFGGVPWPTAILLTLALAAVLAFIFALMMGLACWANVINKIPLSFLLPAFLLLRDVILTVFPFGGFPWVLPAYSQGQWLRFFQWVDVTGPLGLSAYIYLVNGLLADGLILFLYRREVDKMVSRFLVVFVLALLSFYFSFLDNQHFERVKSTRPAGVMALLQGNIAQQDKWNDRKARDNLRAYVRLSEAAARRGAQLVFWPETAYPFALELSRFSEDRFLDAQDFPAEAVVGAVIYDQSVTPRRQYNGAVFVDRESRFKSWTFKNHLVPFGEYLPFQKYLSRFGNLIQGIGSFDAGNGVQLFEHAGIRYGMLICFEDVFSDEARKATQTGADVLVNISNDAWYGQSPAMYQHLVVSQFRALENRRPLLRATNTGMTAVIGARGEVIDDLPPDKVGILPIELDVENSPSVYTKHGDRWVFGPVGAALIILIYTLGKWFSGPVRKEF